MGKLIDNPAGARPDEPMKWTKKFYLQAAELGLFEGQRCYLFRGEVIVMSPMGFEHAESTTNLNHILMGLFGRTHRVRIQMPFDVPGESMPEPDVAIVTYSASQRKPCPKEAALVVEVSFSSRAIDRKKAKEYAAAQVPEYWILDVIDRRLEVYRNPRPDPTEPLGFTYDPPTFVEESGSVRPLAMPDAEVKVADLLTPKGV